jgi:hypothetical protein
VVVDVVLTEVDEVELVKVLVPLLVLVLLMLVLEVLVEEVVEREEVTAVVVTWLFGKHWEYQGFWATQVLPDAQQVAPDQPLPPH